MAMNELYNILKEIIGKTVKERAENLDLDSLAPDTDIIEPLGITSIIAIEIIVRIENHFKIEFDDEYLSIAKIRTLATLADYVEEMLCSLKE